MLSVCFTAGLSLVATSPCLLSPSTLYSPLGWGWQQDILPPSSPAIPRCLEARDPICCTAEPWLSLIFPDPDTVTVVITVWYSLHHEHCDVSIQSPQGWNLLHLNAGRSPCHPKGLRTTSGAKLPHPMQCVDCNDLWSCAALIFSTDI